LISVASLTLTPTLFAITRFLNVEISQIQRLNVAQKTMCGQKLDMFTLVLTERKFNFFNMGENC